MRNRILAGTIAITLLAGCASVPPLKLLEPTPPPETKTEAPAPKVYAPLSEIQQDIQAAHASLNAAINAESSSDTEMLISNTWNLLQQADRMCEGRTECDSTIKDILRDLTWRVKDTQLVMIPEEPAPENPSYLTLREDPIIPKLQAERDWVINRPGRLRQSYYNFVLGALPRIEDMVLESEYSVPEIFGKGAQESNWNLKAGSPVGAKGPLQFMSSTARNHGLTVNRKVDERFTLVKASRTAIKYMDWLKKKIGSEDFDLLVSAYNCGPGCQNGILRRAKTFEDIRPRLNRETANHAYFIRAAAEFYRAMEENDTFYNVQVHPIEDNSFQVRELSVDLSLEDLAFLMEVPEWLPDGWLPILQLLNDEHGRYTRELLPAGTEIRIPTMAVEGYEERLSDPDNMEFITKTRPKYIPYVVRGGDTLGRISQRFRDCTLREIADENKIRNVNKISPGQQLRIPCDKW